MSLCFVNKETTKNEQDKRIGGKREAGMFFYGRWTSVEHTHGLTHGHLSVCTFVLVGKKETQNRKKRQDLTR